MLGGSGLHSLSLDISLHNDLFTLWMVGGSIAQFLFSVYTVALRFTNTHSSAQYHEWMNLLSAPSLQLDLLDPVVPGRPGEQQ